MIEILSTAIMSTSLVLYLRLITFATATSPIEIVALASFGMVLHVCYEAIYTCYFPGHKQLFDIKCYLNDLGRTTVTNLGVVLGILYPTMRDLPDDDFLNRVVTLWLNKADNVGSRGEPSWRSLVQGLRHNQVRQNGIANSIAEDHCIKGKCSSVCVG